MTCDVARELCSALLDEALDLSERAALEAHLAGCADCRRELDDLRRTVAVLHAVEGPRAPVGFVDRVMATAWPVPWHRRLRDRLAAVRILRVPVEAAAIVVVASLAVYVFHRTPELQEVARSEAPVATPDVGAEKVMPWAAEGKEASEETSGRDAEAGREKLLSDAPQAGQETAKERAKQDETRAHQKARLEGALRSAENTSITGPAPPVANPSVTADRTESASLPKASSGPAPAPSPAPTLGGSATAPTLAAPPPAAGSASPPADPSAAGSAAPAAPPRLQMPMALPPAVPAPQPSVHLSSKSIGPAAADVIGRLRVRDRAVAERDLAALIAGVGAVETSRREDGATTVLEVAVPRDRYAAFQEKLERLGAWHAEATSPQLPDRVRVTLRIGQ